MVSARQIFNLLKQSGYNLIKQPPKWRFSCLTVDGKDKELAYSQLRSNNNQELEVIIEVQDEFKANVKSQNAFSFFNGRSALNAIIEAYNFSQKDEVILSPYCCVAVSNAFKFKNVNVRFADIEPDSLSIDIQSLKEVKTEATKAVVIPHILGYVARDLLAIQSYCREHNLILIEDCAQAMGATLNGIQVGNFGDSAFFSFEKSKVISCVSGGMASTNNPMIAELLESIQNKASFPSINTSHRIMKTTIGNFQRFKHPLSNLIKHWVVFFNKDIFLKTMLNCELESKKPENYGYRMDSLTASLLNYQLRKFKKIQKQRRASAKRWQRLLGNEENLEFVKPIADSEPAYCRLGIKVDAAEKEAGKWNSIKNYQTGRWYSTLLDPADVQLEGLPVAKAMCKTVLNLPLLIS